MAATVAHGSFTIGRTLQAPVEKVWAAFADPIAKKKWFKGPDDLAEEHTMDFRVGGSEHNSGVMHDGLKHRFEAHYYDIVPNERLIYTYEMYLDDRRISVSLATMEFQKQGTATYLQLTEDGVFLDGLDAMESRQRGTEELFEALRRSVE